MSFITLLDIVEICFYSILVSFFCLGITFFIAAHLILREKKLLYDHNNDNDNKITFDLTNSYIPPKNKKGQYEWYKHDLMTYFDNVKYDEFVSDIDGCFKNAQVINFDIIQSGKVL